MLQSRALLIFVTMLFAISLVSGCEPNGIAVQDSLDFDLFDSELHTPYVEGADLSLSAWRQDGGSVVGWSFRAVDGDIFELSETYSDEDGERISTWGRALVSGETELEVVDSRGRVRTSRTIRVERPDTLQMVPAGLSRVRPELASRLELADSVSLLDGGTATFEVAYFKDDERLFGNGVLGFGAEAPLVARNEMTYLFRDREWLVIEPTGTGVFSLPLQVNGQELGQMQLRVVDEGAIANVEILAEETQGAEEDDMFYLLARAFDGQGEEIFGVAFDWKVDGDEQVGQGDLYAYHYRDGAWAEVDAAAGTSSDSVSVQMDGGYVTSSNNLGCATAPGSSAGLGLLGLLGLFLARLRHCD